MTTQTVHLDFGWGEPIRVEGSDDELAFAVIARSVGEVSPEWVYETSHPVWSGVALAIEIQATHEEPAQEHVLDIDKTVTFGTLVALVGEGPNDVRVRYGGYGADPDIDFISWLLDDALPIAGDALTVLGAFQLAVAAKRAAFRGRYREGRALTRSWLAGGGDPPAALIDVVNMRHWWAERELKNLLGLSLSDARPLMMAANYRWVSTMQAFGRPMPLDAVN